ncbi:MAG: hypothetical protein ABSC23_17245 [Bryobacteraceae bacterium]
MKKEEAGNKQTASPAAAEGVSYKVRVVSGTRGSSVFVRLVEMDGVLSVRNFEITLSWGDNLVSHSVPCSTPPQALPGTGMFQLPNSASFELAEKGLKRDAFLQGVKDACSAQQARYLEEQSHRLALQREEEARQVDAAMKQKEAEAARREAAAAKRETEFRDGILAAVHTAEEPDPFASIRGEFDLGGSDSRQWNTSLQLPEAEKCRLLKTPPTPPASLSAWTLGCTFRASNRSYEQMVKSVQSVLNLQFQPDEAAVESNRVFFADAAKPAWRLYVARMSDVTVGASVVAVRVAGVAPTEASASLFTAVPVMLPIQSASPQGGVAVQPGNAAQSAAHDPQCEAYLQRERDRISQQENIQRLTHEMTDLQAQHQAALQQATNADQQASTNESNARQGAGTLGAINGVLGAGLRVGAQQKRAEAQNLEQQIALKQAEITRAQTSLISSVGGAPPPGCTANGAQQASGGSLPSGLPNPSGALPLQPTIHDEVEKIRTGSHAPMPPAQRAAGSALTAFGRTTMTVKNSTAYELSVFFEGPVSQKLTLAPGASRDVDLAAGTFHVAGRVVAANVLPFYGEETYAGSASYSVTFYIAP